MVQELAEREDIEMPNPTYTLDNNVTLRDEEVQRIARALKEQK